MKENTSQLDQSRLDNSSHVSDNPKVKEPERSYAISQSRASMPRKSQNRVLSRHDQSDRMTAIDEERELQQIEE